MSARVSLLTLVIAIFTTVLIFRMQGATAAAAEDDTKLAEGIRPGDAATVYLRGDAGGAILHDRLAATGNLINRTGKIVSIDRAWVVLDTKTTRIAVPREAIALVEIDPAK